jgi:hypothetical protein
MILQDHVTGGNKKKYYRGKSKLAHIIGGKYLLTQEENITTNANLLGLMFIFQN